MRLQDHVVFDLAGPLVEPLPELNSDLFYQRKERLECRRRELGLDAILVYSDREHSANLLWLCGFSPRFEEALWVQGDGIRTTLFTGNENAPYARGLSSVQELGAEMQLHQPFSLPNQDRSRSSDLQASLRKAGVRPGQRVGVVGWKVGVGVDVPHFIVSDLEALTGQLPVSFNEEMVDPTRGLRVQLEPEMIRFCEHSARRSSRAIYRWIQSLKEGVSEFESAQELNPWGQELSCHTMVNFGRPIVSGLKSPRNERLQPGQYAQAAFGLRGSLTCRSARLCSRADADRFGNEDDYLELVDNYLKVVAAWYASLKVGADGRAVFEAADQARTPSLWSFALNPGHLLHWEEWLSSPFYSDSPHRLQSGMAIQQDIIPVPSNASPASVNMEDGVVIVDEALKDRLHRLDSNMLRRMEGRRRQMIDVLGYELPEGVLPLSDISGAFFPFLLEPRWVASPA